MSGADRTAPRAGVNVSADKPQIALDRSPAERCREFKYRFAQSVVFGLPVVGLAVFGPALGGPEAARWIGLLQVLLGGWVIYVGALGMLVEALLRRKWTGDGIVAAIGIALYLIGAGGVVYLFVTGRSHEQRRAFAVAVVVLCAWTGMRWGGCRRASGELLDTARKRAG